MRENILERLELGKTHYEDLLQNYKGVLPDEMYVSADDNYTREIPQKWVNNLIAVINNNEGSEVFTPIETYDQAISFFQNEDLDSYIDDANANQDAKFISETGKKLSSENVIETIRFGIEMGTGQFGMWLQAAKLSSQS